MALQQVAAKEKIIFFGYGAEGDEVTGKFCSPYTFRVSPNTEVRSMAIANFLATKPFRKFYTMNMDYAFGHDAAKGFIRRVKQAIRTPRSLGRSIIRSPTRTSAPISAKSSPPTRKWSLRGTGEWTWST